MNIFDDPQIYRKAILSKDLVKSNPHGYSGKSFICVFFTRFCGVGCPFCFFKSAPVAKAASLEDQFTEQGNKRFIEFANAANPGYLQISGGGEAFHHKKYLLDCVEQILADRIMLVTSGSWAVNLKAAEKYVSDIAEAISKRKKPARVTIRLSVSEGHSIKLGMNPITNLVRIFEEKYRYHQHLTLQLKSFDKDTMLEKSLKSFTNYQLKLLEVNGSDDKGVKKVIPRKFLLTLPSGYEMIVGISRVFEPGLRPNLNNWDSIKNTIEVYNHDLEQSEDQNSAVVFNQNGEKGLDWIIEYNGNVCTWQNRVQDNLLNIYEDSFEETLKETFKDPLTLSYIEKGAKYREKIINEISIKTVHLMKAVSVRDYAGTLLFEDEKIRLYYSIRVLQDYIKENRLNAQQFELLPEALKSAILSTQEEIKDLYQKSSYSIVDQEIKRYNSPIRFRDFLELIKLGHFELTQDQVSKAIQFYNSKVLDSQKISSLDDITHEVGEGIERRLTQRVMELKPMNFLSLETVGV